MRSQVLDRQEEEVEDELRKQARRVLLQQIAPVYYQASGSQNQQLLEECVTACASKPRGDGGPDGSRGHFRRRKRPPQLVWTIRIRYNTAHMATVRGIFRA